MFLKGIFLRIYAICGGFSCRAYRRCPRPFAPTVCVVLGLVCLPLFAAMGQSGGVSTDHSEATKVGAAILASGGNAVDAAVASALSLGVVNPSSSGIGGGGFAVVYIAATQKSYFVDFREQAPAAISPSLFTDPKAKGLPPQLRSRQGGLAVGVPGEIAGLHYLSKHFGKLGFARSVAPVYQQAKDGFFASDFLVRASQYVGGLAGSAYPMARDLLVWSSQKKIVRTRLAQGLRLLMNNGQDVFYKGPIAKDIVDTVKKYHGVMQLRDLAEYRVVVREPLVGNFRDYRLLLPTLPSSGGIALLEALAVLQHTGAKQHSFASAEATHLLAEALQHAFADRARYLGAVTKPEVVRFLLNPQRLQNLAKKVKHKTQSLHHYGDPTLSTVVNDSGTSHLCAIDKDGNGVALTTTINGYFGAGITTQKYGIVLNNEMDDFSTAAGQQNQFGLVQSKKNAVSPGRRPLSSMTPMLLVRNGKLAGCVGGSGGPTIISNTLQVMWNVLVHKMTAKDAVFAPRIHHQWIPQQLVVDKKFSPKLQKQLRARGHDVKATNFRNAVQLLLRDDKGKVTGAGDPRKDGLAVIVKAPLPANHSTHSDDEQ